MMKRRILAAGLALLLLLALTACGGSREMTASDTAFSNTTEAKAESAPQESASMDYGGDVTYETYEEERGSGEAQTTGQKLIRTAWLEMETTSFDEAAQGVADLTEELEGYFENSTVTNRRSGSRWADYTIRIPAEKYDAFLNQVGELCHVTRREATQEDISEAYYDTAGRLKTQQIKLERLQALLAEAEQMEDIITIESAISETEWQIDDLSGTLRRYDGKVNYATVYVNLSEVYKLSNVEEVPDSFGARMGSAFTRGLSNFGNTLEELAVGFAYSWMWWLLAAVVLVVVIRVVKGHPVKLPKLKRGKKGDKKDET